MNDVTPPVSAIGFDPPEEHVVLAAAEDAALLETARVEKVAVHVGDRSSILRRRPVPIWVVAAALIGGATLALSAQAVIRRPVQNPTASATARGTASGAATNPIVVQSSAVVAPSTLAPGVVALLPVPQDSTIQVSPSATTVKAPHRARTQRSTARTGARSRDRTEASAAKWVDPFMTKRPTIVAPPPVMKSSVTTPATAKWVDPFAN